MQPLRGKTALVTGAANRLGLAIAKQLVKSGVHVYLWDVDEPGLERAHSSLSTGPTTIWTDRCNLACIDSVDAALERMRSKIGIVDLLVNNAGVSVFGPATTLTQAEWDRVLAINLLSPIRIARALLPDMMQLPAAHILNVCSIAGLVALPKQSPYHTSKFGLVGFSESLRIDLARTQVGVTAFCPGLIDTGMLTNTHQKDAKGRARHDRIPQWLLASPERVARQAIRAVEKNRGLCTVTSMAHVLFAARRVYPGLFDRLARVRRPEWLKKLRRRPTPLSQSNGNPVSIHNAETALKSGLSKELAVAPPASNYSVEKAA